MYKRYPRTRKYLNFILKSLQNNHVIIIFICKLILELIYIYIYIYGLNKVRKIIFITQSNSESKTGKSKINYV